MSLHAALRGFLRSRRATAAIEFAFIAPVLIVMGAGLLELSRGLRSQTATNQLASQYAIAWADCTDTPAGTCLTELGLYSTTNTFTNIAPQLTASKVIVQMFQVSMVAGAPVATYSYPTAGIMTASQIAAAKASLSNGQNGVIVTVNYTFTVDYFPNALGGIVPSSIPMTFTVVQLKA